ALAFVRLRWIEVAEFGGDLADELLVRAFDGDLGVFLDRNFDLLRDIVDDRMRVAEAERDVFAGDRGLETDAGDLKLFHEPVTDSLAHVVEKRAAQAVQGPGLGILALAAHQDIGAVDSRPGFGRQFPVQLAFGTFDMDLLAFDLDLHPRRDRDRLFSNA